MGKHGNIFLASFNRIEKWLREQEDVPHSVGFTELVRRLGKRSDLLVRAFSDDLIELAQLRNAIIHDKISPDFIIAEPNEWVLNKMAIIEQQLTQPERVVSRFKKEVAYFKTTTSLAEVLKVLKLKGFSQFPITENEQVIGLVSAHGLGMFLAQQELNRPLELAGKTIGDVLLQDRRRDNYQYIPADFYIFQAVDLFLMEPRLEALLITEDGQPSTELLGIIRPKEIFQKYYKEWWRQ